MSTVASRVYAATQTDDPANSEPDGYYPTPPSAVRALLTVERFRPNIWEPACGCGSMARALEAAGYRVLATDLVPRGYGMAGSHWDFLTCQPQGDQFDVMTNPPFATKDQPDLARRFVQRALDLTRPTRHSHSHVRDIAPAKVAMFLRLAFLEGRDRGRWFPGTPLARVYVMSARVKIQRGRLATADDKGGTMAFAWFVWEHGHIGPPSLHFLDWKLSEGRQVKGSEHHGR